MPHDTPLIATIVVGLCLAFVFGAIAQRLRVSPLVGYLLAGVALGPYTPGFVADQSLASELAEIGVILLMFGVGLHFSLKDLWSVRLIAVPGAIVQIAVATMFGIGLGQSARLADRRRHHLRPGAVGGQHRRAAARLAGAAHHQHRARAHRRRLADRRRPRHGADAGAAAGAGSDPQRQPAGAPSSSGIEIVGDRHHAGDDHRQGRPPSSSSCSSSGAA